MKKHTLLITAFLGACSGDTTESGVAKVAVDEPTELLDADGDGAAKGTVDGDVAELTFELGEPLPEIAFRVDGTEDAAVLDVVDALSFVVSSPRSGVTATLEDGELVAGPPDAAGEWSVELADDRMSFTVSWYNETRSGLTMKSGETYDTVFSLDDNCCVAAFPATSMPFTLD
ncbi:MAG: hypothetical protein JNK45_11350 [Myxococcales bacterium]|nr:hypothetical protein [Myxococcales bacterium]